MNVIKKLRELEDRIRVLEEKPKAGRRPTRLEEAKKYLREKLKGKVLTVDEILDCEFDKAILRKAKNELGYYTVKEKGVWKWSAKNF
jgi:hypothetical protein